jgi:antitoxin PrlF
MMTSQLSEKGQTTIPKQVRELLQLRPHDRLEYEVRDGMMIVRPLQGTILDHCARVKPKRRPEDFRAIREQVLKDAARTVVAKLNKGSADG